MSVDVVGQLEPRLFDYMCAAISKDFAAVFQLVSGNFAEPLCNPPTAALDVSVQLCSGKFECCKCGSEDCRRHADKLTLLRAACMDGRWTQVGAGESEMDAQGAVIALLLLAGSDDLEGARAMCGLSYETSCDPVFYAEQDFFPRAVLKACTVPAAQRAANWSRVLRRLSKADSKEACMQLAKSLFLELCCKDVSPTFFEDAEKAATEAIDEYS